MMSASSQIKVRVVVVIIVIIQQQQEIYVVTAAAIIIADTDLIIAIVLIIPLSISGSFGLSSRRRRSWLSNGLNKHRDSNEITETLNFNRAI